MDVTLFGLISKKDTLKNYKEKIGSDFWKYYHKCLGYLLENLGRYLAKNNIQKKDVKIVVEASKSFKRDSFRSYIVSCQANAYNPNARFLKRLDVSLINDRNKGEEPFLVLADLVANSLFQCVNDPKSNYGVFETAYINDLRSRFFCSDDEKIIGYGLKAVHLLEELKLDKKTQVFLQNLKANSSI